MRLMRVCLRLNRRNQYRASGSRGSYSLPFVIPSASKMIYPPHGGASAQIAPGPHIPILLSEIRALPHCLADPALPRNSASGALLGRLSRRRIPTQAPVRVSVRSPAVPGEMPDYRPGPTQHPAMLVLPRSRKRPGSR